MVESVRDLEEQSRLLHRNIHTDVDPRYVPFSQV